MSERTQQKRGYSVDSSCINVDSDNNNHLHKISTKNKSNNNQECNTTDSSENVLSTHSLFDVNQQRKTSISFDKIKQLTLALSLPSGDDLDIAPDLQSINDQKLYSNHDNDDNNNNNDNLNYNEKNLNSCQQLNNQLNDNASYKLLSSSSSAEEASSSMFNHHNNHHQHHHNQSDMFQSVIHDHHSSSSLINTPTREKQSTSYNKLKQSNTKLAPDNEQDSGLESEFGLNDSMGRNSSKFSSSSTNQYTNNIDSLQNNSINNGRIMRENYDVLYQSNNRDYPIQERINEDLLDEKNQTNILRQRNPMQYAEESEVSSKGKFFMMNSPAQSSSRNTSDNISYISARTNKLNDYNTRPSSDRYFPMNPDISKFRPSSEGDMEHYDEQFNPHTLDNTYSFNMSTRSPQRLRQQYIIRGDSSMEDNDSNLGIKLTQTQNNQKVTVTMISHNNIVKDGNKFQEQPFDPHHYQYQIDPMIGTPEHKIRDMNADPKKILRNQGENDYYKANRLNYSPYQGTQRKLYSQDDDYEKSQRQSPQVEWSNVPHAPSHTSSNYEGSSTGLARSRSPQSECSSNRIKRKIINPSTGILHDKAGDEDANAGAYPQMVNAGNNYLYGRDMVYSSPTKFPSKPFEGIKPGFVTPYNNDCYKTDEQDRTFTSDDYSTITANYSINSQNQKTIQVMTKLSSPISGKGNNLSGSRVDRATAQSTNKSRMPVTRLSSCGDILQIDVEGSDLSCDKDGGIEIVIGNMTNQSPASTRSRNPFLTDDYPTPSTLASDVAQNSSYYLEGQYRNNYKDISPECNMQQQQQQAEILKNQSNFERKSFERRQSELPEDLYIDRVERSRSRDFSEQNLPTKNLTSTVLADERFYKQSAQYESTIESEQLPNNEHINTNLIYEQLNHNKLNIDFTKDNQEDKRMTKDTSFTQKDGQIQTTSLSATRNENTQVMQQSKLECPIKLSSEAIQMKPIKLRNLINGNQTVDTLHQTTIKPVGCTYLQCMGSIINPEPVKHAVRSPDDILEQAKQFLNQYYTSIKRLNSPAHKARIEEIKEQIKLTKTYYLKETELIFGAKLAWRNAPRCIGRIQWSKLQVFDARFTTTTHEMFEALCNHIRYATNKGSLRSAITIFPQRIKSTKYDYRVWNSQLIGYAGYRIKEGETTKIVGDPANADFTEICQKLGWKGAGTRFDVLPLVLSANGGAPQFFPLPEDLVLRVKLHHPKHDWFKELGLEWYALPAVSSMMLDVGGLQFPAAPFSGWYMVTEIGTRDLGDASRYNILESVAQRMGLDTTTNVSLWRDQALVEVNLAVLESFQRAGATIVDHHTASETFMTHLANEQRLRGGCPADWVWIVPPTGGSTTQVYHQEMVNYHLLPNYEYLEPAWKTFDLSLLGVNGQTSQGNTGSHLGASPLTPSRLLGGLTPRKLRFKEIARAVKFTSKLFGKALSRRIKATILYATETGKSERYANKLAQIFSHAFNVHLMCMNDYDMTCLEHEALLLIVTSTFGNGDPPENGETFARQLHAIKLTGDTTPDMESVNFVSTTTFTRVLSSSQSIEDPLQQSVCPLSNVRFAVFSLGSTAYPNFCAFGRYVDQTLGELGAERILKCECGDELCGQEKAFAEWSKLVFRIACDVFCISDNFVTINERTSKWNPKDVKFIASSLVESNIQQDLINMTNKKITPFKMLQRRDLHSYANGKGPLQTICVDLETIDGMGLQFEPGDHVAIYPTNNIDLVEGIIEHMKRHDPQMDPEIVYKILVKREDLDITPAATTSGVSSAAQSAQAAKATTSNSNKLDVDIGALASLSIIDTSDHEDQHQQQQQQLSSMMTNGRSGSPMAVGNDNDEWILHDRLPVTSIREALTRFLDITTPASQEYLSILGQFAEDVNEKKRLQQLATNSALYEEWKHSDCPNLLHVLNQFKSIGFKPTLLTQLPLIQPRFYSISSSPTISESKISLTVGIIRWVTRSGHEREGVCSNYLNRVDKNETIYCYIRSAPSFHMPHDASLPMILIGPGTGIAPFRSFWQFRESKLLANNNNNNNNNNKKSNFGEIDLYFGCRNHDARLYKDELEDMVNKNVITHLKVAYSRLTTSPKQYVQDVLNDDSERVRKLILKEGAHVYVCGDVAMAEGVHKQLHCILSDAGSTNLNHSDELLLSLREQNRYHEDIFGAKPSS